MRTASSFAEAGTDFDMEPPCSDRYVLNVVIGVVVIVDCLSKNKGTVRKADEKIYETSFDFVLRDL